MDEKKRVEQEEELLRRDTEERKHGESQGANAEDGRTSGGNYSEDLVQKKVICSLAYLFGILFFLPLVFYPDDSFAKFHANQSLVILLTVVIGEAVFGVLNLIPAVGFLFGILCGLFGVLMLVACVLAILGVVRNEKYALPVLGTIRLLR